MILNFGFQWVYYSYPMYMSLELRWNDIVRGKPKITKKIMYHIQSQIPNTLTRTRTLASTVKGRQVTACDMVRPNVTLIITDRNYLQ
jgi:hypothetical protein